MLELESLLEEFESKSCRSQMTMKQNSKPCVGSQNKMETEELPRPCTVSSHPDELRFIRPKEVAQVLGISRQQLWRMGKAGTFINPVRIGDNAVAYRSDELLQWMNNCQLVDENKKRVGQPHPTLS